jgi:Mg-chelatase subunit ChlD
MTKKVFNLIVLDESGSMLPIMKPIVSGLREVIQQTRELSLKFPEQQHFISLVSFNGSGIKVHLDKMPVNEMADFELPGYRPAGSTPLYDALGSSLLKLKADLQDMENAYALVNVFTDGAENSSVEFYREQINAIISEQKAAGWTFSYIGANHDVEQTAHSISITNTITFESNEHSILNAICMEKLARIRFSDHIASSDPGTVMDNYYEN